MQFTVSKSVLCGALALVNRASARSGSIPILKNVKLAADGETLTVTATDLDVALSTRIPAKVVTPGAITLPATRLHDYARLLSEGDVAFKVGDTGYVSITAGKSRTRIAGISAEAFPELPAAVDGVKIPAAVLVSLVKRTQFAISTVASRFTLAGALMAIGDGTLRIVATDGHRMALAGMALAAEEKVKVILPLTAIKQLPSLAEGVGEIEFGQDENHLFFRAGDAVMTARKLTGSFPDYERVLPKSAPIVLSIARADLAAALSRVGQFSDERSRSVKVAVRTGEVEVSAASVESGESSEAVTCDYDGSDLEIGLNGQYVSEFLSVADGEKVTLHLVDGKTACEFRPAEGEYRYVVMPMRI